MNWLLAVISGLGVGILSGLVGIGGGVVLVPLLLYIFKVDMHVAAGTSLAIIIPTAIVGAVTHFRNGNVALGLSLFIVIGAIIGSYVGASLGNNLSQVLLKRIFAIVLLLISIKVLIDSFSVQA